MWNSPASLRSNEFAALNKQRCKLYDCINANKISRFFCVPSDLFTESASNRLKHWNIGALKQELDYSLQQMKLKYSKIYVAPFSSISHSICSLSMSLYVQILLANVFIVPLHNHSHLWAIYEPRWICYFLFHRPWKYLMAYSSVWSK